MITAETVVRLYDAIYTGPIERLQGEACQVLCRFDNESTLRAKFQDKRTGELAYGWHKFFQDEFEFDYFPLVKL